MSQGVLTARQDAVLQELGPVAAKWNFYLGGGIALALQLGHRRSIDFDWFAPRTIEPEQLAGDADSQTMPPLIERTGWREMKDAIRQWVKEQAP